MIDAGLEEEDEGYFASMTDIMVGLLFVFIIIIMFFALQISEAEPDAVSRPIHEKVVAENERLLAEVAQLDKLRAENERLRTAIDPLKLRIAQLEEELAARDRTIAAQITELDEERAENERLRRRIEELERELNVAENDRLSTYLAAADARRELILRGVRDIMAEAGFEVDIVEEQGVVRLPNDLLFDKGSSTIENDSNAARAVSKLAEALAQVLPCYTRGPRSDPQLDCNPSAAFVETVFVEGHTDDDPVLREREPGISSNLRLSARRASNIFERLRAVDSAILDFMSVDEQPVLNVAAYGDTRPIPGNTDKDKDRRIDLRFLMVTPRSDTLDTVQALVSNASPGDPTE